MKKITDAQIKSWKAKYGDIYAVDVVVEEKMVQVPTEKEGEEPGYKMEQVLATGVFRKPDLDILSAAEAIADDDNIKKSIFYFDNCWLGGDQRIKDDEELKLSAALKVVGLFKVRAATVKKL